MCLFILYLFIHDIFYEDDDDDVDDKNKLDACIFFCWGKKKKKKKWNSLPPHTMPKYIESVKFNFFLEEEEIF